MEKEFQVLSEDRTRTEKECLKYHGLSVVKAVVLFSLYSYGKKTSKKE